MLSFRTQLAIIILASVAMVGLAAVLIRDAITQTEDRLLAEARQQSIAACRELRLQYEERAAFVIDDPLEELPLEAQDVSLRGLSETVLRSYEGVEGGFFLVAREKVVGYSGEKSQLAAEELSLVLATVAQAKAANEVLTQTAEWDRDLAVVAAAAAEPVQWVVWTMKRLSGVRDPVAERRRWLLALLVLSALLGVGGIVSVWFSLHWGVASIRQGLGRLEENFQYRLTDIRGEFGQIASAINQMTAKRMALETELRRKDRLAALGKAIAGVAHEIRNPLNSMKLTLELLNRRLSRGAATADEVTAAIREVDRLDRIVGRLLAFGQPVLTDRHAQDVMPLLSHAVSMVHEQCRQKNVRIATDTGTAPEVIGDIDGPQIQQVIINLLLNAIDASPPSDVVTVKLESRDDHVAITIEDNGPGIPEDARAHIFDVYFTTKPDGVGLGLSVSREIVVNHGGRMEFESGPEGTTFRILLPVERNKASETQGVGTRSRG